MANGSVNPFLGGMMEGEQIVQKPFDARAKRKAQKFQQQQQTAAQQQRQQLLDAQIPLLHAQAGAAQEKSLHPTHPLVYGAVINPNTGQMQIYNKMTGSAQYQPGYFGYNADGTPRTRHQLGTAPASSSASPTQPPAAPAPVAPITPQSPSPSVPASAPAPVSSGTPISSLAPIPANNMPAGPPSNGMPPASSPTQGLPQNAPITPTASPISQLAPAPPPPDNSASAPALVSQDGDGSGTNTDTDIPDSAPFQPAAGDTSSLYGYGLPTHMLPLPSGYSAQANPLRSRYQPPGEMITGPDGKQQAIYGATRATVTAAQKREMAIGGLAAHAQQIIKAIVPYQGLGGRSKLWYDSALYMGYIPGHSLTPQQHYELGEKLTDFYGIINTKNEIGGTFSRAMIGASPGEHLLFSTADQALQAAPPIPYIFPHALRYKGDTKQFNFARNLSSSELKALYEVTSRKGAIQKMQHEAQIGHTPATAIVGQGRTLQPLPPSPIARAGKIHIPAFSSPDEKRKWVNSLTPSQIEQVRQQLSN